MWDGGADADVFIFDTDHGAYSMEASLSYGVYGAVVTRNINIYGQPYAPAKSLTIDASNLRTFYTGDTFNPGELVVTATRANGAEESIWGGRLTFTGYDSDTTGTKTVTASFLGATATFEVQVEDLVTEQYTGSYELVQGETPTATDAVLLVDYSPQGLHADCRRRLCLYHRHAGGCAGRCPYHDPERQRCPDGAHHRG